MRDARLRPVGYFQGVAVGASRNRGSRRLQEAGHSAADRERRRGLWRRGVQSVGLRDGSSRTTIHQRKKFALLPRRTADDQDPR